ncbi:MAG: peptidoglycan-associated lipoprotein [Acidobacteria bacterium]|nr:MAG: peptidoglycan-associated lipoprotein [Acidobacteriota bacterium]PIE90641.1 MAG: peptidoglycan-associated lipoprotein [Acidobacteriota bacterium]
MKLKSILLVTLTAILMFSCKKSEPEAEIPVPVPEKPKTVVAEPVQETVKPVVTEEKTESAEELLARIRLDDVYFEFDKSDLTDSTRRTLYRYVEVLRANPRVQVLIEGHCDERGTIEYNQALGERRAERVRSFLMESGVGSGRLSTVSYGKMQPVNMGHNEDAWAQNRRAHFRLGLKN